MLGPPEEPADSAFKNPRFYLSMAIVVVAMAVGWIVISRWEENREIDAHANEARRTKQQERDKAALDQFGGNALAILGFYAIPGEVRQGQGVQICYSVANAKSVKLEPQSNPVWPSYSRCVDVTPTRTTAYTLTIADASGKTKTQTLEIQVR